MSEEFAYKATFRCEQDEAIELLKEVASCMDNSRYDDIEEKMAASSFSFDTDEIKGLINNSYYDANLAKALAEHSDQSHGELGVESEFGMSTLEALKKSPNGTYEICAEGADREADEFCKYLTIFLHALGATDLKAKAGGSYWVGRWDNSGGKLRGEVEEDEC